MKRPHQLLTKGQLARAPTQCTHWDTKGKSRGGAGLPGPSLPSSLLEKLSLLSQPVGMEVYIKGSILTELNVFLTTTQPGHIPCKGVHMGTL